MQVDLTKTDREICQVIGTRCADFGIVKSVKLQRTPTPYALVEMSTHQEMLELAAEYGGSDLVPRR